MRPIKGERERAESGVAGVIRAGGGGDGSSVAVAAAAPFTVAGPVVDAPASIPASWFKDARLCASHGLANAFAACGDEHTAAAIVDCGRAAIASGDAPVHVLGVVASPGRLVAAAELPVPTLEPAVPLV